jgi:hypothetical protein
MNYSRHLKSLLAAYAFVIVPFLMIIVKSTEKVAGYNIN